MVLTMILLNKEKAFALDRVKASILSIGSDNVKEMTSLSSFFMDNDCVEACKTDLGSDTIVDLLPIEALVRPMFEFMSNVPHPTCGVLNIGDSFVIERDGSTYTILAMKTKFLVHNDKTGEVVIC